MTTFAETAHFVFENGAGLHGKYQFTINKRSNEQLSKSGFYLMTVQRLDVRQLTVQNKVLDHDTIGELNLDGLTLPYSDHNRASLGRIVFKTGSENLNKTIEMIVNDPFEKELTVDLTLLRAKTIASYQFSMSLHLNFEPID